jgi:hypothetical protein
MEQSPIVFELFWSLGNCGAELVLRVRRFFRRYPIVPSAVFLLLTAFVGVATPEVPSVQSVLQSVLAKDPRNRGVDVTAQYRSDGSVLVFDLKAIAPTNSMADVFRVLLQFAEAERTQTFASVHLAFRGQPRFILHGDYFKKLGDEYSTQNPVYTMRTFTENVFRMDGSRAYPTWTGGLIGVVAKQTEQFGDFHKEWYLNDLLTRMALAPDAGRPAIPAMQTPQPQPSTQSASAPAAEVLRTPYPPERPKIPNWAANFPGATNQLTTTSAGSVDLAYSASVPVASVVTYYEEQLHAVAATFKAGFDGLGTSIRATDGKEACVIHITEMDAGTRVKVSCALSSEGAKSLQPLTPVTWVTMQPTTLPDPANQRKQGPRVGAETGGTPPYYQVEYNIDGSAGTASLTYRNALGQTEQREVRLPYTAKFHADPSSFLYLSAQKSGREGTVHVVIRVSDFILHEASSSSPFGIAAASGSIPKDFPHVYR